MRQLTGCFRAQRNKINRLPPGRRFLGAAGGHHLSDNRREHSGRVLPADHVEALEGLVDEVERMSGIGKYPLSLGCEQDIGEYGRRETSRNRREQSALGRLAMAHFRPALKPALERGRIRPASEWCAFPSRRLAVTVRSYSARAVEQCQIGLFLR